MVFLGYFCGVPIVSRVLKSEQRVDVYGDPWSARVRY
jgi:hypothetical protein